MDVEFHAFFFFFGPSSPSQLCIIYSHTSQHCRSGRLASPCTDGRWGLEHLTHKVSIVNAPNASCCCFSQCTQNSMLPLTTLRVHDQTRRNVILTSVSSMSELGCQGSASRQLSVLSAAGLSHLVLGMRGIRRRFPVPFVLGLENRTLNRRNPVFREQVWKTGPCSMKGTCKP